MIRILIVDDLKTVRESIKILLESEPDLEVIGVASDGYEAVNYAKDLNPDVILMDVEMPGLDGFQTTRLIRQQNEDIKILILTINEDDNIIDRAIKIGAKGTIYKNMSSQDILKAIRFVYEGHTEIKPNSDRKSFSVSIASHSNISRQNSIKELIRPQALEQPEPSNTSHNTAQNTIDWLALWSIIERRWQPAAAGFLGVLTGGICYLLFARPIYTSTALIMLDNRQESISELGRNLSQIPEGIAEYSPLGSLSELITSRSILQPAIEGVAKQNRQSTEVIPLKDVQDNLEIEVIPSTNILEISYSNSQPKQAADLLNAIVASVVAKNTENIRSQASSIREFLEGKVAQQRIKVRQAEALENQYRKEQGLIAIDNQTNNLVNGLSDLENQEQELVSQIQETKARVDKLQQIVGTSDSNAYVSGRISQDRELQELRDQLSQIESELSVARTKFTEASPIVQDLVDQREAVTARYNRQLGQISGNNSPDSTQVKTDEIGQDAIAQLVNSQAELAALDDRLKAVTDQRKNLENRIASLPDKVQSLSELVLEREEAKASLSFLQRKLEEARIAEAQLLSNIQIVDTAAVPTKPSSPKQLLVIAISTLVGTVLAFGIALLLEKLDDTLYHKEEVEQKLSLPFLSSLPYLDLIGLSLPTAHSFLQNRHLFEPYRALLKKLEVRCQQSLKIIVVSSATAGEGKSIVASHLGAVSAMLSKRTLIIDCCLFQPEQHNLFDISLRPGLREIVAGEISLQEAIKTTNIKNLSLLTTGRLTVNSCAILESTGIKSILQQAIDLFDLVIIDAPSLDGNYDAYTLSQNSNGLLMVTRPFHTPKNVLEQTVSELKTNNAPILGFVINNTVQPKSESDRQEMSFLPTPLPNSISDSNGKAKEVSKI